MFSTLVIVVILALIFSLASFGAGLYCIARYAKTRKVVFLVVGVILTFILPGICMCAVLGIYIPSTTIVYGPPPPPTSIVYGPPPSFPTSTP